MNYYTQAKPAMYVKECSCPIFYVLIILKICFSDFSTKRIELPATQTIKKKRKKEKTDRNLNFNGM